MKRTRFAALLAGLLFTLSSCSAKQEAAIPLAEAVQVQYDTAVVVRGDLAAKKQYEAYIKATVESVAFENRSGLFKQYFVALGDLVKKGDPIAEMDMSETEKLISEARNTLSYLRRKLEFDLEQKQFDIDLAEVDLASLKANGGAKSDLSLAQVTLDKLRMEAQYISDNAMIDIRRAQENLDALIASMDGSIITAPCDGEVVKLQMLAQGDRVAAFSPVCYIADSSRLYVQYDGADSLFSGDRYAAMVNGKEYDLTKVEYDSQEYLRLVLAGKKPPAQFNFAGGLTADDLKGISAGDFTALMIYDNEKKDVLQVPINSLFYSAGINYVYKMENGMKTYTEVTVGFRTPSYAEIINGLQEGDEVFVKQ